MFQYQAIQPDTLSLLKSLATKEYLVGFQLVGGTALALQRGHRISTDIDLFSSTDFSADQLMNLLNQEFDNVQFSNVGTNLIQGSINGVKIDFACHKYQAIQQPLRFEKISITSLEDIAAMKLAAILSRAKKRDFIDLAELLKVFDLSEMLDFFKIKYEQESIFHVVKSLTYFEEADADHTELKILVDGLEWPVVKESIGKSVKSLS
ncbi:MAG: nucleotidyl transferase AbiEii/AbiGii toxin family protein [Cyclobacteriaceae bacterium]